MGMDKVAYNKKRSALARAERDVERLTEELDGINEKIAEEFKRNAAGVLEEIKKNQEKLQTMEKHYQAKFKKEAGPRLPALEETKKRVTQLQRQLVEFMDTEIPPEAEVEAAGEIPTAEVPGESPAEEMAAPKDDENVVQMAPPEVLE